MSGKRYYWLRLKDDFFTSKRIKKLRAMAGGDTYLIIYLKMQLLAMKSDGVLKWTGLEENFADELALDLDEKSDDVAMTMIYLLKTGLAETSDNITFFFPYAVENTGSETSAAERMRKMRERNSVTPMLQERYGKKKIDNRDREKSKSKKFVPPTLEEVKAYIAEKSYHVDAQFFFDYYDKGEWKRKDGTPVLNWKQTLVTWEKKDNKAEKPKKQYTTAEQYKPPKSAKSTEELMELVDRI